LSEPTKESRALFPPWSDSLFRLVLILLFFGGIIGTPALLMAWVRTPLHTDVGEPLAQPIQFDHRHHVRDDGIHCQYCHYDSERSSSAGMPDTATCMGCHAQIWKDSAQLEPVRRSFHLDEPIRWNRVHDMPDFVYFNHAVHVAQGVGCETCHGRVDLMAVVYKTESMQMGWCLDCHREPERFLRPPEKVTEMGYEPDVPQEELGARLARELNIHPPTYCTGCHR
jgi:hypothetical protein